MEGKIYVGISFRDYYSKSVLIGRVNCKDMNFVFFFGEV